MTLIQLSHSNITIVLNIIDRVQLLVLACFIWMEYFRSFYQSSLNFSLLFSLTVILNSKSKSCVSLTKEKGFLLKISQHRFPKFFTCNLHNDHIFKCRPPFPSMGSYIFVICLIRLCSVDVYFRQKEMSEFFFHCVGFLFSDI